jgi:hypothetical protein
MDLINFYCRILGKERIESNKDLEKGLKNTNPIIGKGGREAFLSDIEKLKNAH